MYKTAPWIPSQATQAPILYPFANTQGNVSQAVIVWGEYHEIVENSNSGRYQYTILMFAWTWLLKNQWVNINVKCLFCVPSLRTSRIMCCVIRSNVWIQSSVEYRWLSSLFFMYLFRDFMLKLQSLCATWFFVWAYFRSLITCDSRNGHLDN